MHGEYTVEPGLMWVCFVPPPHRFQEHDCPTGRTQRFTQCHVHRAIAVLAVPIREGRGSFLRSRLSWIPNGGAGMEFTIADPISVFALRSPLFLYNLMISFPTSLLHMQFLEYSSSLAVQHPHFLCTKPRRDPLLHRKLLLC